jgi:hypothetical protein
VGTILEPSKKCSFDQFLSMTTTPQPTAMGEHASASAQIHP